MDKEGLLIRRTQKEDLVHILKMIQDLADFEKMPNGPKLSVEDLIRDGNFNGESEKTPLFFSFVAEYDGKLIGYTISFYSYSTWEGKSYFLEDLYMDPTYRSKGFGKSLFKANVEFALQEKCSRFDFHVLAWNPAKKFYLSLGAQNLTEKEEWEFFRLNKSEMENLMLREFLAKKGLVAN